MANRAFFVAIFFIGAASLITSFYPEIANKIPSLSHISESKVARFSTFLTVLSFLIANASLIFSLNKFIGEAGPFFVLKNGEKQQDLHSLFDSVRSSVESLEQTITGLLRRRVAEFGDTDEKYRIEIVADVGALITKLASTAQTVKNTNVSLNGDHIDQKSFSLVCNTFFSSSVSKLWLELFGPSEQFSKRYFDIVTKGKAFTAIPIRHSPPIINFIIFIEPEKDGERKRHLLFGWVEALRDYKKSDIDPEGHGSVLYTTSPIFIELFDKYFSSLSNYTWEYLSDSNVVSGSQNLRLSAKSSTDSTDVPFEPIEPSNRIALDKAGWWVTVLNEECDGRGVESTRYAVININFLPLSIGEIVVFLFDSTFTLIAKSRHPRHLVHGKDRLHFEWRETEHIQGVGPRSRRGLVTYHFDRQRLDGIIRISGVRLIDGVYSVGMIHGQKIDDNLGINHKKIVSKFDEARDLDFGELTNRIQEIQKGVRDLVSAAKGVQEHFRPARSMTDSPRPSSLSSSASASPGRWPDVQPPASTRNS